jgi:signal transduction histidine kinase
VAPNQQEKSPGQGAGARDQQALIELQSGALHNIGNIVTVSQLTMHETINDSSVLEGIDLILGELLPTLCDHAATGDIAEFLGRDESGRHLLKSINALLNDHRKQLKQISGTLEDLYLQLQHVSEILDIHRQLGKGFGRRERQPVTIAMENAATLMAVALRRDAIQLHREFEETDELLIDGAVLVQVFTNLVRNAIHALVPVENRDRHIWLSTSMEEGHVLARVRDNGVGIDAAALPKIFDYGFTTRTAGSGVGLHYCKQAIGEIGGRVEVTAELNQGATFTIYLHNA